MKSLHHMGLVAHSLDEALEVLPSSVGPPVERIHDVEQGNIILIFNGFGAVRFFEVIVPHAPYSTVATYLKRHGSGFHHFAFQVNSISLAVTHHAAKNDVVLLDSYKLRVDTFGGAIVTQFLVADGVLMELLEVLDGE